MERAVVFRGKPTASLGDLPPQQRPIWAGTIGPVGSTPARVPGSIRRTSSVDIIWAEGATQLWLHGLGRDLKTGMDGSDADPVVVDVATVDVVVAPPLMEISAVSIAPCDDHDVSSWLRGKSTHFKLRTLLDRAHPDFVAAGTVAGLLVDEIPGASLIAGAALGRAALAAGVRGPRERLSAGLGPQADVCAGWITDGSMHVGMATRPFMGEGPPAPSLARSDDPFAWHAEPPLVEPGTMRRRRRIDLLPASEPDGPLLVDVYFRDSFVEPDGVETIVHEYGISLTVESASRRVISITPVAHVLPSPECPAALQSAQRLIGLHTTEIRAYVRDNLRGTSTCTHLNDALRSIGDLDSLIRAMS